MAGNFQGWLIKFGNVKLPNSFLLADGWEDTPNQRLELKAYRDANAFLHRETSENYKTSLKLNIKEMSLEEMMAFKNILGLATLAGSNKHERRLSITYWNDETLNYSTAEMYMPDVTYTINHIDEQKCSIEYNPFTIELIEY